MNMFRSKPNQPLYAELVHRIAIHPNFVTQYHANASVPLLLNGSKVLTVVAVALVPPADLDLE
jgi:hypothetical protein